MQTPRLDAFAGAGVRFAHCVSNAPVCTPYRGMLLSGRHPLRSSEIIRRVVLDEDLAVVQMPLARRHEGWNGRLKGRPVDLLPGSSVVK